MSESKTFLYVFKGRRELFSSGMCHSDETVVSPAQCYHLCDISKQLLQDTGNSKSIFYLSITRDIGHCTLKPFHQCDLCRELLSVLCGNLTVIPGKLILGFIDATLESSGPPECVQGCTAARMNARSMRFKQNKAVVLLAVTSFVL